MVGNTAMDTVALTLDTTFWDAVAMFAGYYYADHHPKEGKQYGDLSNMTEIVLSLSKSFGPLETSVALIYDDPDYFHNQPGDIKDETMLQLYLTYTF